MLCITQRQGEQFAVVCDFAALLTVRLLPNQPPLPGENQSLQPKLLARGGWAVVSAALIAVTFDPWQR